MDIQSVEPGTVGPCPVAPDALQGIVRQQTNPARWNGAGWQDFAAALRAAGVELAEGAVACGVYATDAATLNLRIETDALCVAGQKPAAGRK